MHVQSLEPRQLMAVYGLDDNFGRHGRVTLDTSGNFETTLATPDAIYVESATGSGHAIYKLDRNGRPMTSFGISGRAAFTLDVDQLAYDTRTGFLYASGSVSTNDFQKQSAYVFRLSPLGKVDKTFGENGLAIVTPRNPGGDTTTTAHFAKLLPQADGSVLTAVEESAITRSGLYQYAGTSRVRLLKLTAAGALDSQYGNGGSTTIFSGGYLERSSEYGPVAAINDKFKVADVQQRDGGAVRVIAEESYTNSIGSPSRYAYIIASRVVTSAGAIEGGKDQAWSLAANRGKATPSQFAPLYIAALGDGDVQVVGDNFNDDVGRIVFTLNADGSYAARPLKTGDIVVDRVVRTPTGQYFGATGHYFVKLLSNFAVDTTWGDNGQAQSNDNAGFSDRIYIQYTPDYDGGVIETFGPTVTRLDGTPPARNTQQGTARRIGGLLDILGTAKADSIRITTDTTRNRISVILNGTQSVFDSRTVTSVALDAGAGDDDVLVLNTVIATAVAAGRGNDRVISGGESGRLLTISLGIGDDRAVLSEFEVPNYIDGGAGFDTVRSNRVDQIDLRNIERRVNG